MLFSHDTKADALGQCPFFADLSRSELIDLAKATEDMEVEEGKALTREGESGREFFVIIDGEVSVTKNGNEIAPALPALVVIRCCAPCPAIVLPAPIVACGGGSTLVGST